MLSQLPGLPFCMCSAIISKALGRKRRYVIIMQEWSLFMKEIEFDVELTAGELYRFTMRHTYVSLSGIFGLLISAAGIACLVLRFDTLDGTARLLFAILGLLFTVVQPVMLFFKTKAQVRKNKNINASLHYCLGEEGIRISRGEEEVRVKWHEVRKKVLSGRNLYLYMSPVRAFIFPERQCGGQFDALVELTSAMMEKYRDHIPEQEEEQKEGQDDDGKLL